MQDNFCPSDSSYIIFLYTINGRKDALLNTLFINGVDLEKENQKFSTDDFFFRGSIEIIFSTSKNVCRNKVVYIWIFSDVLEGGPT